MISIAITAKSKDELEQKQDQAISLANERKEPVVCKQRLKRSLNAPCMCGSERKWKHCCIGEAKTQVTFYPKGWKFEKPKPLSRSALAVWMGAISKFTGGR